MLFGRGLFLFRLFGIAVKLDPSWFVIALLITWTLATQFFPTAAAGLDPVAYWAMGVFGALGLFASILAHEFGHALVAQRRGLPMRGITLFIFGGVAEMTREPDSATDEFLVAIAGPIVSIVIGGACTLASWLAMPDAAQTVVGYLGSINLVLVAFNMIPAFPLDGGRVLRSALWAWRRDLRWATSIASQIGGGFGLALILLGVAALFGGAFVQALWFGLIGLFLRSAARQSYEQVLVRETLAGQPVRAFMNDQPRVVPVATTVDDFVDNYVYRHHYKMFPMVDDGRLRGCVSIDRVRTLPRDEWHAHRVAELAEDCSDDNTIRSDADATDALAKMVQSGRSRLMVTDGDRLVGVIALKDLVRYIELRRELEPPSR